jgi:hypothetical protein
MMFRVQVAEVITGSGSDRVAFLNLESFAVLKPGRCRSRY